MGRVRPRHAYITAVAVAVVLVLLLVAAQLVLPRIAERRVRDELDKVGVVSDVQVHSFPAVKLLFGDVDSLTGRLAKSQSTSGEFADLIARARKIDRLRVSAKRLRVSGLNLADARLAKDGANLHAEGSLDERDLLALVPPGLELTDVSVERGSLVLVGSFSALGVRVSAPARVVAEAGNVVLKPEGLAGAAVSSIPVFSDDHVQVSGIEARETGTRLRLTVEGTLDG